MRNRTVGRPPSRTLTASGRSHPSSARPSKAPCTTRGSVRPVHSFRYTSRAAKSSIEIRLLPCRGQKLIAAEPELWDSDGRRPPCGAIVIDERGGSAMAFKLDRLMGYSLPWGQAQRAQSASPSERVGRSGRSAPQPQANREEGQSVLRAAGGLQRWS